ncbi:hypothetical protein EXJ73_03350 [Pelomonas aquatica]|uniref:Uncharacterized protein n=1 Tax=Pelomonas aquatica TaxID=431058 RepID=A0A9X4R3J6_9BURK|nr:hypothetical protein [Pelomonas aquatica]
MATRLEKAYMPVGDILSVALVAQREPLCSKVSRAVDRIELAVKRPEGSAAPRGAGGGDVV